TPFAFCPAKGVFLFLFADFRRYFGFISHTGRSHTGPQVCKGFHEPADRSPEHYSRHLLFCMVGMTIITATAVMDKIRLARTGRVTSISPATAKRNNPAVSKPAHTRASRPFLRRVASEIG